jgi:outer membrane protein
MRFTLSAQLLAVVLLGLTLGPLSASAQSKVGVVDISRALSETEDGHKAKAKLKQLFDSRQKALDKKKDELMAMKESVEKQASVLSRDVLAQKSQELQKAFAALQGTYMEFQKELAAKEGELTKGILERMERIVRRIGQAEGYGLILDRNEAGVVYVPTTYDLTDVLIQRYNAGEGSTGGDKKAATKKPAKKK